MDTHKNSGFTIIEVVLFLTISSVLGIGILASASAGINQQRYKDSVRSLYSHLQLEYSRVINVENSRIGQYRCDVSGVSDATVDTGVNGPQSRGTSTCVIIGRIVDISGNPGSVHSEPVYATVDAMRNPVPPTTDRAAFDLSNLQIAREDVKGPELNRTNYDLEWGTRVVNTANNPLQIRLLIIRSPLTGMVRTYTQTGQDLPQVTSSYVRDLAQSGSTEAITACVDSTGLFSGPRMGVAIASQASSSSSLALTTANGDESEGAVAC